MQPQNDIRIGIIGLGYVGFPLACLFARKYQVVGFDLKQSRVDELNAGQDSTLEVDPQRIAAALQNGMRCTTSEDDLRACQVFVVAVPTPVTSRNLPDLEPMAAASRVVGSVMKAGSIVVYESTVYPGTTEEFCAPILEQTSGLKLNRDFYLGYSPERINPGDKQHTVEKICKITSGSTPQVAQRVDQLYASVLEGGTHRAPSIKVAEAAKILENTQRDVNIAVMNEVAKIFNAIGIDTQAVLAAAGTKWNFLPFTPGLVGGHCISVDPYYLIDKAMSNGIVPRVLIESRRVNDTMGAYIASRVVRCMVRSGLVVSGARILLLGFTFKENCPDVRNTKVLDIYHSLQPYTQHITVFDPWADAAVAARMGVELTTSADALDGHQFDAIVHCVSHTCFATLPLQSMLAPQGIVYDVKGTLPPQVAHERL